jgi:hypothetical protein
MHNPLHVRKVKLASVGLLVSGRRNDSMAVTLTKRAASDSYPGAFQVTAHGKLTPEELELHGMEGFAKALLREVSEELGGGAAAHISTLVPHLTLLEDWYDDSRGKRVVTFGLNVGNKLSDLVATFEPEDGVSFEFVGPECDILPLEPAHKLAGAPHNEIRMFSDDIRAVKAAVAKMLNEASSFAPGLPE